MCDREIGGLYHHAYLFSLLRQFSVLRAGLPYALIQPVLGGRTILDKLSHALTYLELISEIPAAGPHKICAGRDGILDKLKLEK